MEKEAATHSTILAWEIPWTEEPSVLSMGLQESHMTEKRVRYIYIYTYIFTDIIYYALYVIYNFIC